MVVKFWKLMGFLVEKRKKKMVEMVLPLLEWWRRWRGEWPAKEGGTVAWAAGLVAGNGEGKNK